MVRTKGDQVKISNRPTCLVIVCVLAAVASCRHESSKPVGAGDAPTHPRVLKPLRPNAPPEIKKMIEAAVGQHGVTKGYDPSYVGLSYPGGDVPTETGVCSDVIVRAFRAVGIDLQKEVHEDMTRAFAEYPTKWGLGRPDRNIDHRRVPNLMTYFTRRGKSIPVTSAGYDYQPGDIVTWDLGGGIDHIGIVTDIWSESTKRCLIVHNVGAGVQIEDVLFRWRITGHYRYF